MNRFTFSMKLLLAAAVAIASASPSFAASTSGGGTKPRLADDSWLWSTGDFHPDRGMPNEQPLRRDPQGQRDTA